MDFSYQNSLLFWLSKLNNAMQDQFNRDLQRMNVTWSQWLVVNHLGSREASTPAVIAQGVGLDRSAVTRLLDRLEQKALVERYREGLDRRSISVKLSAQGQSLIDEINSLAKAHQNRFLSSLPTTEHRILKNNLQKLLRVGGVDNADSWHL